jgi:hypothetical protein
VGALVGWPFPKRYPCLEVAGLIPADYTSFNRCLGDTWWPLSGPCVSILFTTNKPRVIHQLIHMTTNTPATCHMVYHVLYSLPRQHPYGLYGLYSQHNFFFFACFHFEQNTISLSSDVYLNLNKLCWVRDDEVYTLVQFEVIPSTFNFEQHLIPWITPPHWKAFGPPKYYCQSI